MTTTATTHAAAIREAADDIVRQLEDGQAPHRRSTTLAAGGHYFEAVRVYFADIYPTETIPRGVARIALDVSPLNARRPAHEVAVYLESPGDGTTYLADDIAAAVLDMIDGTADYAR